MSKSFKSSIYLGGTNNEDITTERNSGVNVIKILPSQNISNNTERLSTEG